MTVEERRARQRAYWARNRDAIAERRRRAALAPARVDELREQDRSAYARNRSAVLDRKRERREADPERLRAQARASYARHGEDVKRAVMARFWRDSLDLKALWRALEKVREVRKPTRNKE